MFGKDLRYHQSKVTSLDELPPPQKKKTKKKTSYSLRGHLLRSFYSVFMQVNCLTNPSLEARQFGFEDVDGSLVPSTCHNLFPHDVALSCSCLKCATVRCHCRKNDIPCCIFCKCHSKFDSVQYKNPFGIIQSLRFFSFFDKWSVKTSALLLLLQLYHYVSSLLLSLFRYSIY